MAIRIKNQWFNADKPKSPRETASAMAFIVWRVTQNMVKQMREAKFDIDVGPSYFAFMREALGFLCQVVDRMAFETLPAQERVEFTSAMIVRVAEILEESEQEWLGEPASGLESWRNQFIGMCNDLGDVYSDFGHGPEGPDFAFVRCFGSRLEEVLPTKDRHWVKDQVMAYEVPEALEMVKRGFQGVYSKEPRPKRRAGHTGD